MTEMTEACLESLEWLRECSVCYTRGLEKDFITCEGCGVMVYCGKECQQTDWDPGDAAPGRPCHQALCARMKRYAAREAELCDLPFMFAKETTDRMFYEEKAVEFLKRFGVYGQGLWRRESPLLHKTQPVKKCGYYTDKEEAKWVLKEESTLLTSSTPAVPPPSPSAPLRDWQQYYVFRELPFHSPAAAVLTCPLTLARGVPATGVWRNVCRSHAGGGEGGGDEGGISGQMICDTCALTKGCQLHIVMIGKQLSKTVNGYQWERGNLRLSVHCGFYHDTQLPAPHIAVGFNAGLPAYPSWPPTLTKLMKQGTPAYFTDQSEYSCDCVSEAISSLGIPGVAPVIVNPFRSPLRIVTREQNMPWFPNAFLYRLLYEAGYL